MTKTQEERMLLDRKLNNFRQGLISAIEVYDKEDYDKVGHVLGIIYGLSYAIEKHETTDGEIWWIFRSK